MGRKNSRQAVPESDIPPIPVTVTRRRLETREERDARIQTELGRKRDRNLRRIDARVGAAVDWSRCCIPGCETDFPRFRNSEYLRNAAERLPVCGYHETIIATQGKPHMLDAD